MQRSTRGALGMRSVQNDQNATQADPWVTIDKTVRGLDEEKVHDCKEDMDTLLVFAGLYSAVLTSFLMQSYQNLLENPQQTSVELLRQISAQTGSYTLSNGYLNSTAPPASPSALFQAGTLDVRVNVCWFASLILSLSTASFGMLVKQWLREYLAINRTVTQERMRIRHFRARGLEEWKLFDIAAALPVVLQLSLALFFIGLCWFTAEIHPSLRTTSLLLVCAWAALFGFTFLAPLVSARCPYKTTFLKTAFQRARPHLQTILISTAVLIRHSSFHLPCSLTCAYWWSFSLRARMLSGLTRALRHVRQILRRRSPGIPQQVQHDTSQLQCTHDPTATSSDVLHDVDQIIEQIIGDHRFEDVSALEEGDARIQDANDLVIFKDVDSILCDDQLLEFMRGALQRRPRGSGEVLKFVAAALSGRLGIQARGSTHTGIFKMFDNLAPSTTLIFINVLSDALQCPPEDRDASAIDVIKLVIVLARAKGLVLPESAIPGFQRFFSSQSDKACWILAKEVIAPGRTAADWQVNVFKAMSNVFRTHYPSVLRRVVYWSYVSTSTAYDPCSEPYVYGQLLEHVRSTHYGNIEPEHRVTPQVLEVLLELAIHIVQDIVDKATLSRQPLEELTVRHIKELVQFLLDAVPVIKNVHSFIGWYEQASL
ncbi:hypothetical protein NM688_g3554 [Phlebia brevispora]|uniref:Uncharacterized protein n=1 Tax=Phlebia brevispora TaxID=194682 RepID=A0ACC1T584_9APHY|nr:hypothetical protein NM688_g3554 [Phlebia brevispora]